MAHNCNLEITYNDSSTPFKVRYDWYQWSLWQTAHSEIDTIYGGSTIDWTSYSDTSLCSGWPRHFPWYILTFTTHTYVRTHTHTCTHTHAQLHICQTDRWVSRRYVCFVHMRTSMCVCVHACTSLCMLVCVHRARWLLFRFVCISKRSSSCSLQLSIIIIWPSNKQRPSYLS